jgi:cytochrome d ubiquinol oxidase subunit I
LSYLSFRDINAFVPGITDLMEGGYDQVKPDGTTAKALSADEKMQMGDKAVEALAAYKSAKAEKNDSLAALHKAEMEDHYAWFGYGFVPNKENLIPPVPLVFYTFHLMVILGMFFLALFLLTGWLSWKKKLDNQRWLQWIALLGIPLAWVCSESGWIVAEVGRQPWVIQDIMPTYAAVSALNPTSVLVTFILFAVLFTVLLIAEIGIILKQIRKGPEDVH